MFHAQVLKKHTPKSPLPEIQTIGAGKRGLKLFLSGSFASLLEEGGPIPVVFGIGSGGVTRNQDNFPRYQKTASRWLPKSGPKMVETILIIACCLLMVLQPLAEVEAQPDSAGPDWIRPENTDSPALWGIRGGIVFSLWPAPVEPNTGGPRGLLRIGHNFKDRTYLINFIAVEPVVDGDMEFSEISPSRVDGKVGKLMWASGSEDPGRFRTSAITRGNITHPDPENPDVEMLSIYVFMEKFLNGAHPYLKVNIRSDRPREIGLEIFNREGSAPMERCALTATMGNYSRVRLLYLKDRVVDSREFYKGYDDIHFIEKDPFYSDQLLRDDNGDFIVMATSNESFSELSSWPQDPKYYSEMWWRYRPFYKVTQYWRKDSDNYDESLRVRVNGRARYWSGGSDDKSDYIKIPGGISFENFEMREDYYPGQKFYFGITRKSPQDMGVDLTYSH